MRSVSARGATVVPAFNGAHTLAVMRNVTVAVAAMVVRISMWYSSLHGNTFPVDARRPTLASWKGTSVFERLSPWLLFALAIAVRALPFPSVFKEGTIYFRSFDAYYHLRRIRYALGPAQTPLEIDSYIHFPSGGKAIWPSMFDGLLASLLRPFVDFGEPRLMESILVWVPPVLGACTVVVAFLLARRHLGLGAAWLAGLLVCILPAQFFNSQLSRLDHHVAVALASTLLLAAGMKLLTTLAKIEARPGQLVKWHLFLALAYVGNILLWPGSILHVFVVQTGFVVCLLFQPSRSDAISLAMGLALHNLLAALAILPFSGFESWPQWSDWSPVVLTRFQPWFFAVQAIVYGVCAGLWRWKLIAAPAQRILAIGVVGGVGFGASMVLFPQLRVAFDEAWQWMAREEAFQAAVGESKPLFSSVTGVSIAASTRDLSWLLFAFPFALVAFAYAHRRSDDGGACLLLTGWSLVFAIITLAQKRFQNTFSVAFALVLAAIVTAAFARTSSIGSTPRRFIARLGLAIVLVASLWSTIEFYCYHLVNVGRFMVGHPLEMSRLDEVRRLHFEIGSWLRDETPAPGGVYDAAIKPDYAVLAPWGMGHTLKYVGERPTIVDNFGDDVGRDNFDQARKFGFCPPLQAASLLRKLGARYVIVRRNQRAPTLVRLFFHEANILPNFRLVFESTPLGGQGPAEFKVFECVWGADVEGRTTPGAAVVVTLDYQTNQGRSDTFWAATRADWEGTYRITLPYATVDGGGAIRVAEGYSFESAGCKAVLHIEEGDVVEGRSVVGPDLTSSTDKPDT